NAREFFHGTTALGEREHDGSEACKVVELGAEFVAQDTLAAYFQDANAKIVAAQRGSPEFAVVGRIDDCSRDALVVTGRRQSTGGGPHAGVATIDTPETGADDVRLEHSGLHDALRHFVGRQTAFQKAQAFRESREGTRRGRASWRFAGGHERFFGAKTNQC